MKGGKSSPILEMRGVDIGALRDRSTVILKNVNWTVAGGDFWVVGGVQGSGKTDLMMTAGGLIPPVSGSCQLLGESMPIFEEGRLAARLKIGLVFDGGQLLNHLTVAENIALPIRYHHNLSPADAKAEVQRMLEMTGLAPWADNTPGAIGRNWQQRVGLARALMLRPEILLVDNPLGGLDLRHRSWWLNFLGELSAGHDWFGGQPLTLVVTGDDLRPWRNRAKQIALLKERQFVELGSWEQLEKMNDASVVELMTFGTPTG